MKDLEKNSASTLTEFEAAAKSGDRVRIDGALRATSEALVRSMSRVTGHDLSAMDTAVSGPVYQTTYAVVDEIAAIYKVAAAVMYVFYVINVPMRPRSDEDRLQQDAFANLIALRLGTGT